MADDSEKPRAERSDLEKIADILLRHRVEFLVIGGQGRDTDGKSESDV
jgi:hypothetical protein